jgi:hypothetical protein
MKLKVIRPTAILARGNRQIHLTHLRIPYYDLPLCWFSGFSGAMSLIFWRFFAIQANFRWPFASGPLTNFLR